MPNPTDPPAQEPPSKETVFVGRYQLVERLAVGGMAEVFLGARRGGATPAKKWQPGTDTLVVIKRILPHLAEKPEFVEAFVREARITEGIHDENVVRILELGEAGGLPFLVMEYVSGSSLKQLIVAARRLEVRMPADIAVSLVAQAASGLHAAHELTDITGKPYGLVHRDISPHNLMVDETGVVKLLDFGIAKAEEGMDHTRTGMLKGKISYMSPEQCRQERLDRRADLFSLGVVAFELLTGVRPFQGSSELATMQAIVSGKRPALRELLPDLPLTLVTVIDRAMHERVDERWPTAKAFAEALAAAHPPADRERVSLFVRTVLGEKHDQRSRMVGEALERTLVSISDQPAGLSDRGALDWSRSGTNSGSSQQRRITVPVVLSSEPDLPPPATTAQRRRPLWLLLGAVSALFALVASMASGLGYLGYRLAIAPRGEPIVVRLAPVMNEAELQRDHEPIRLYLERRIGRPVRFEVAASYEAAAEAVLDDTVDYAFLPAGTVRWLAEREPGLVLLAVKVVDGSASTDGYLLSGREAGAPQTVADLRGKTICLADPLSSTGWRMPRAYLESQGFDLTKDVAILESGTHEQVLVDLLAGRCEAGATYSGNFNTADQRGLATARLRILATTGSAPHDAFVADEDADPETTAALQEALVGFDPRRDIGEDRAGASERISGFVKPPADYLGD
jgi:phosphate/phosphite/phosphonate ABC transporter binding protein